MENDNKTISPTEIMMLYINKTKKETREIVKNGGLDCITKGVLSLMESAGRGDMKAVDIVVNRIDGLMSDKIVVKPIVVEIVNYGEDSRN